MPRLILFKINVIIKWKILCSNWDKCKRWKYVIEM